MNTPRNKDQNIEQVRSIREINQKSRNLSPINMTNKNDKEEIPAHDTLKSGFSLHDNIIKNQNKLSNNEIEILYEERLKKILKRDKKKETKIFNHNVTNKLCRHNTHKQSDDKQELETQPQLVKRNSVVQHDSSYKKERKVEDSTENSDETKKALFAAVLKKLTSVIPTRILEKTETQEIKEEKSESNKIQENSNKNLEKCDGHSSVTHISRKKFQTEQSQNSKNEVGKTKTIQLT